MDVLEWGHDDEELDDFQFEEYENLFSKVDDESKNHIRTGNQMAVESTASTPFGLFLNDYAFSPSFHDFIGQGIKEEGFDTATGPFINQFPPQELQRNYGPNFQQFVNPSLRYQDMRSLVTVKEESREKRSYASAIPTHLAHSNTGSVVAIHDHKILSTNHQGVSVISGSTRNISMVQHPNQPPPSKISHTESTNMKTIPSSVTDSDVRIVVDGQPPVEVRTRTPSEIRTFSVTSKVEGNYKKLGATIMKVQLMYAANDSAGLELVPKQKKEVLGGTRTVPILSDGSAIFDNLSICESSTRHKERVFCLEFILTRNDGYELMSQLSKPFYAYSHKKVLLRRGSVKLRTLSKSWGKISGGETMHVIGSPFIQGPALSLIFKTPHGEIAVKPLEFFSDSVLFFELPPYPVNSTMVITSDTELRASVMVTNDGRTFSNAMEFTYIAGS